MGKIYRTTTSFESVMCFQWRNDLWVSWPRDSLNIWTWRNDFFSALTDLLDFIWLFAAKLCYRHMLKTAPEVKAKLGDDLEVFRPARWIASEARELFLEQQNSKDLFLREKYQRIPAFLIFLTSDKFWLCTAFHQGIVKCPPFDSLAFGHGARICLGKQLADYEGRLVIAQVRAASLKFCTCRSSCHQMLSCCLSTCIPCSGLATFCGGTVARTSLEGENSLRCSTGRGCES